MHSCRIQSSSVSLRRSAPPFFPAANHLLLNTKELWSERLQLLSSASASRLLSISVFPVSIQRLGVLQSTVWLPGRLGAVYCENAGVAMARNENRRSAVPAVLSLLFTGASLSRGLAYPSSSSSCKAVGVLANSYTNGVSIQRPTPPHITPSKQIYS